jgi:hypothetical protein
LNGPAARLYTERVRAWVAVCVLLPAALASASEHRISVPGATGIEVPAVTRQGNWEVEVAFDPVLCEVLCVYRLRADRFGRPPVADLLLPPAIQIRVFYGKTPSTLIVDPARTSQPVAASDERPGIEDTSLSAARPAPEPMFILLETRTPVSARPPLSAAGVRFTPLPLRI